MVPPLEHWMGEAEDGWGGRRVGVGIQEPLLYSPTGEGVMQQDQLRYGGVRVMKYPSSPLFKQGVVDMFAI